MDSLEIYKHEFETKIQFYYFVYDSKLPHFKGPFEKDIELFSLKNNSLDKKLIEELDSLAIKFNKSGSDKKRFNSAKYAINKIEKVFNNK
jgi:hypothetical protein